VVQTFPRERRMDYKFYCREHEPSYMNRFGPASTSYNTIEAEAFASRKGSRFALVKARKDPLRI